MLSLNCLSNYPSIHLSILHPTYISPSTCHPSMYLSSINPAIIHPTCVSVCPPAHSPLRVLFHPSIRSLMYCSLCVPSIYFSTHSGAICSLIHPVIHSSVICPSIHSLILPQHRFLREPHLIPLIKDPHLPWPLCCGVQRVHRAGVRALGTRVSKQASLQWPWLSNACKEVRRLIVQQGKEDSRERE